MSDRQGKKIKRREFLKSVSKAALPTIAVIGLAGRGRAAAKSEKAEVRGPAKEPTDCVLTCEGGCRGCEGECLGTCKEGCFLTCEGSCKYTCGEGFCKAVCADSCNNNCTGTCRKEAW